MNPSVSFQIESTVSGATNELRIVHIRNGLADEIATLIQRAIENAPAPVFTQNSVTLAEGNGVIRESTTILSPMPARKPGLPAGPLGMNPNLPMGPTLPPPTPVK